MHLLILTPQFPYPPHQGTTLRNYNLIKGLAQRHRIDLFCMLAPGDEPHTGPVNDLVRHIVTAPQPFRSTGQRFSDMLARPLPDMALRLWSEDAFGALCRHFETFPPDLIQAEGIEMAPYVLALQAARYEMPLMVYDAHNAETLLQQRAFQADVKRPGRWAAAGYSAVQTRKLLRYERQFLESMDGIAAVSESDAAALRQVAPGTEPVVVTNGIDLEAYNAREAYPDPYQHQTINIVFTGKMDFRPNIDGALWFANRVLPLLHASNLNAHFWIVGKNPHARLDALQFRPDVTITGAVADIQPYIAHADLYVVPLQAGGGTRFKILEALAMDKPLVSTTLGADGFPVSDGEQLALADTPEDFAARCVYYLQHQKDARAMARRGLNFVSEHYTWTSIVPELERLYHRLASERI